MIAALFGLLLAATPGPRVAAVRLEVPPGLDAARFERHLGELVAGEPLDPEKVRHVVEVLHASGELEDVLVETQPVADGVEVLLRLRPAPLLAGLRVEGDAVLSAGSLREIARLRLGEALWPARLETAARDVALHLTEQGYLESRATARAERRPGGGADAVFRLDAGPRARVESVSFAGAGAELLPLVRRLARPVAGQPYRRQQARRAAAAMTRRLVASGRWRASVEPREEYDPARAAVALTFELNAGPLLRVEFEGARLDGGLRGRIASLLREGGARADVLDEATEQIEGELRRRGHRDVAVGHREQKRPWGSQLVFVVRPGPVSSVASVTLRGGDAALGAALLTRPGTPLEERTLEADRRALLRLLEDQGHVEPEVEVELPDAAGELPVVFQVRSGPRTLVERYDVVAPEALPAGAVAPAPRLLAGEPFRARELALDRSELEAAWRNQGYLTARVTPEVVFSETRESAAVTLRVEPGPLTRIDHVVLAGLEATRDEVVLRELRVAEGERLGLGDVIESQRRLASLGLFERVSVSEIDPESVATRSVVVALREAPRTTIAYGLGWAEQDRLRASLELTRRNLGGWDRSLSGFVRGSVRGSRFLVTYREPYLLGRRHELLLTAFREEEDRESFDFTRLGALAQTSRRLGRAWNLVLRYSYQETHTFNVEIPVDEIDRQFRDSTNSGPSSSVFFDTRDDPIDPHRGHFVGADVQVSARALGGDSFVKGYLQATRYRPLLPRTTWAVAARLGLARTFGAGVPELLPLPDRFFLGGDYGLRGFERDRVGPLQPGTNGELYPTGGNAMLYTGAELRVDAARALSVAGFVEAGNVFLRARELSLSDLRATAGIGLRYKSSVGPLRIDWGYKLDRRPNEPASEFHFTIGHAF